MLVLLLFRYVHVNCEGTSKPLNHFKLSKKYFPFLFIMEDKENFALSNTQFDDESELSLSSCRELIDLVKINEVLWKKRCVSYKDQQMKALCWSTIGSALTHELSGTDAEKEFYKLRQKFGRERRKEKESAPRSGAGAGEITYISDWPLYNDLAFLKDVIKPRQTKSNFSKTSVTQRSSSSTSPPVTMSNFLGKSGIQSPSPSPSPPIIISNFPGKSAIQKPRPSPSPPITILENSPSASCSSWNLDPESGFFIESDGDNSLSTSSPTPTSTASKKRRIVPAPDSSFVKKRKLQDDMVVAIETQSANLSTLTDKITKCFESTAPSTTQLNQSQDSLFLSVSAALACVPQEKRLSCIIEILQIIQKYTEK